MVEANGKAHICYIEGLDVVYRSETIHGLEHSLQISTLSTATANDACSIDLTSYGRANVVFYNNSDVMFSRQVFESTSYDEETWNTRIIDQNVAGGPLELYIDGEENLMLFSEIVISLFDYCIILVHSGAKKYSLMSRFYPMLKLTDLIKK